MLSLWKAARLIHTQDNCNDVTGACVTVGCLSWHNALYEVSYMWS